MNTIDLTIDPEFKALIPPLRPDERAQLEASIIADGCRDAICTWDGVIIDGHNRYDICQTHGIPFKTVEIELKDRDAAAIWIIDNQFGRRNLAPYQRAELVMARERYLPGRPPGRPSSETRLMSDEIPQRQRAAASQAGIGHDTYAKAKVIAAKADDETKAALRAGETSINAVYQEIRGQEKREARAEANREKAATFGSPDAAETISTLVAQGVRCSVLYADPPWRYEHCETDNRKIENQYPSMDIEAIKNLPVHDVCEEDSVLFLWATSPKLVEAKDVIEAWGFTYRTCMVWVKDKIGMGYYARQRHELLLIATKGSLPVPEPSTRPDSVIEAPRLDHSAKPEVVYELLEAMYPDVVKVEGFARKRREGWWSWGNQV